MLRKAGVVVAVAAVAGLAATSGAEAAGACKLQGNANIPAGLTTTQKPITYTFAGTVANCAGTGALKNGTVTASGSGTGACTGNKTAGSAIIRWQNGQTSNLAYTTNGTGVVVRVAGTITSGALAGQKISANLLFYTTQAALCRTTGVKTASFAGPATLGV